VATKTLQKIRHYFPKYKMIVARDPDLAVVKGAVFMGWDRSNNIIVRAASYSYGFSFKQGQQRENLKSDDVLNSAEFLTK